MLISLQFICLSFLEGKKSVELLFDIIKLSSSIYQTRAGRKEFLIENLNKLAIWSEKVVWIDLFTHFCEGHKERNNQKSRAENLFNAMGKIFKKDKGIPVFDEKTKLNAFEDFSMLLFNLRFTYEFIAETLVTVAQNFEIPKKVPIKILRKNEDKFTQELYDRHEVTDIDSKSNKKEVKMNTISIYKIFEKTIKFLDFKETLLLSMVDKQAYRELKMPIYSTFLLSNVTLTREQRQKIWSKFILSKYSKLNLKNLSISLQDHDDDIILLDVKRTYPTDKNFDKNMLIKILRNIKTVFNDTICYYQGLNYFVAFLMLHIDDPETILRLSCSLLETSMSKYVKEDLSDLR